jgi:acetylornithine aminotransferase
MSLAEQQQLESKYLMHTYKRKPVEFVRGEGMHLYDDTGKDYLDFIAGIGVISVGHCHPQVTQAIQAQAAKLLHVSNYYYVEGRPQLAQKLSQLLGGGTWRTFFANSGAEANEGAIKLARKYGAQNLGGAETIITATHSFHGRTLTTLAATGQPELQVSFNPMTPGFVHVPINNIDALMAALNPSVCAVMLECVQGEAGIWPCSGEYVQAVAAACQERDILFIIDEVQTGFFRTSRAFSYQHHGITPDVVTLAKGMGAGVPIGAFCAQGKAAEVLQPGDHGSTFGGSPLVIAAANAVLDILMDEEFCSWEGGPHSEQVEKNGAYLREQLAQLPHVTEVRGLGLMVGLSLDGDYGAQAVEEGLKAGFVFNSTGTPNNLRFLPPLICTKKEIDPLIACLNEILFNL